MQISPSFNHTQQCNMAFKQAPPLKEVLLKTSETNKVPLLSKTVYKHYLYSKNLPKYTFDKQELDGLFSIEKPRDFAKACFKGMVDKFNIPKKIAPKLLFENEEANFDFGYERTTNSIIINTANEVPPKNEIFALLRHEFQHYFQNIDILRSEEFGDEHINNLVRLHVEEYRENILKTIEDDPKNWDVGFEEFKNLYQIKRDLENGNNERLEKEIKGEEKYVRKNLKSFQKEVIKSLGKIKADSPKSAYLKKIYDAFCEYNEKTNNMSWGDYLTNFTEYEALLAEYEAEASLENQCLVKMMNERYREFIDSQDKDDIVIKKELAKKIEENPKADFMIPNAG